MGLALLGVALVGAGLLWLTALLTRTEPGDIGVVARVVSLTVLACATVLLPVGIGVVEHLLWSRSGQARLSYVTAAALTTLTWGAIAALPPFPVHPLVLGAGLVLVHLLWLVVLARPAPERLARTAAGGLALALLLVLLWPRAGAWPTDLVWEAADQRQYVLQGVGLTSGSLEERYPLGMALLLMPFVLLADAAITQPSSQTGLLVGLSETRLVNQVVMPVSLLVVALMLDVTARLATRLVGASGARHFATALVLVTVVVAGYLLLPGEFVPERNAQLVPRRLLGLVFSYEPIVNLVLAGLGVALLPRERPVAAAAPVTVAGFAVLAIMLREPTAASRRAGAVIAAAGAGFLAVALGISAAARGSVSGRGDVYDGELLRPLAEVRYGWDSPASPPQLSPAYLLTNLAEQSPLPLVAVGAVLVAAVVVVLGRRQDWRPWAYLLAITLGSLAVHAMWVNIVVTFRYNFVLVVPMGASVAALGVTLASSLGRGARARSDRPHPAPAVAELPPGP
jgi:hypothetical protein